MAASGADLYTVHFDDAALSMLKDYQLRTNVDLEKLSRYGAYVRVPNWFPLKYTSYGCPLYFYYQTICKLGQINVARSLLGIFYIIDKKIKKQNIPEHHTDDFVRQHLKLISSEAFVSTFRHSPAYMLFVHLHALGGKSPYTKEQILEEITHWVENKTNMDKHREFIEKKITSTFTTWPRRTLNSPALTFSEYCDDFMRWGTSGGGPRTELYGEEYRTKWAWAANNMLKNKDQYEESLRTSQHAKVALKEEATKTRAVITTPMSSYLRQSYLLYRWGLPDINSPISSKVWLPDFQANRYAWYGCLDGQKFDQSIPKWLILFIIERFGDVEDTEIRQVVAEELNHLENLTIEWGNEKWAWQGGLLSGWRVTSIIGSLISHVAAQFIIEEYKVEGAMNMGVMGDDLILYSNTMQLRPEQLVEGYSSFGLSANLFKTTSGPVGEFLRKTYSDLGILGYPCLALRTIFYANPWITQYTPEFEEEIAASWLTYYSRLLPHRVTGDIHKFIQNNVLTNIKGASKFKHLDWSSWLRTPISAGGGGPMEWSDISRWTTIIRNLSKSDSANKQKGFLNAIGVLKSVPVSKRTDTAVKINYMSIYKHVHAIVRTTADISKTYISRDLNMTRTLYEWYLDDNQSAKSITKLLQFNLPRSLRIASKTEILRFLLGQEKAKSGITSVQITKEQTTVHSKITKFVTASLTAGKAFNNLRYLGAGATVYASYILDRTSATAGTW